MQGSDCLDCQYINLSAQAFSEVRSATLLPTCQLYAFEEKSTAAEMCPSRRQKLARPSPLATSELRVSPGGLPDSEDSDVKPVLGMLSLESHPLNASW